MDREAKKLLLYRLRCRLRFQERLNQMSTYQGSLGALRLPAEGDDRPWELVFDDGEKYELPPRPAL